MALPPGITRRELQRLLDLDEQIKVMEKERDALKDKVKRALPDVVGPKVYGEVILMLGVQNRFDPAAFARDYDPISHPEFFEVQVAQDRVPEQLQREYVQPVQTLAVKRAVA